MEVSKEHEAGPEELVVDNTGGHNSVPVIEIRDSDAPGERRWSVVLLDAERRPLLITARLISKGEARSLANAIRSKGANAPYVPDGKGSDKPEWTRVSEDGKETTVMFSLARGCPLELVLKEDEKMDSAHSIERLLKEIKELLNDAEIKWNPPEADPAHDAKDQDQTPGKGIPGS